MHTGKYPACVVCCAAIVVVMSLGWLAGTLPVHAQEANRLGNASLESPYYGQGVVGQTVPQGWNLWIGAGAPDSLPDNTARDGQIAWLLKQNSVAFTAAGYQQVTVEIGDSLRASAWSLVYTCADQSTNCAITTPPYRQSDISAGVELKLGIDPQGGTDPQAASVVWSAPVTAYDEWTESQVETVATNEQVTVFLYMTQAIGLLQNEIYWDQTALTVTASQPPTVLPTTTLTASPTLTLTNTPLPTDMPTATLTDTPLPTATITSTATATATPTASATATVTPSPTNTPTPTPLDIADTAPELIARQGELCAALFDDTNQNGQRDAGEPSLRGELNLRLIFWTSRPYITSPNEDEYCLQLDANEYELYMVPPDDYTIITSDRLRVTISQGQTVRVAFGAGQGIAEPTLFPGDPSTALANDLEPEMAAPVVETEPPPPESQSILDRIYNASAWVVLILALVIGWAGMRFINHNR